MREPAAKRVPEALTVVAWQARSEAMFGRRAARSYKATRSGFSVSTRSSGLHRGADRDRAEGDVGVGDGMLRGALPLVRPRSGRLGSPHLVVPDWHHVSVK